MITAIGGRYDCTHTRPVFSRELFTLERFRIAERVCIDRVRSFRDGLALARCRRRTSKRIRPGRFDRSCPQCRFVARRTKRTGRQEIWRRRRAERRSRRLAKGTRAASFYKCRRRSIRETARRRWNSMEKSQCSFSIRTSSKTLFSGRASYFGRYYHRRRLLLIEHS